MAPDLVAPNEAYFASLMEPARALEAFVQALRERGHLAASIDPLSLRDRAGELDALWQELRPETLAGLPPALVMSPAAQDASTAEEAVARLIAVYCGTTGYEFAHLRDPTERAWLHRAAESGRYRRALTPEAQKGLLRRLTSVEAFEHFLHQTFPGQYWFSIEGLDALIPVLDEVLENAAEAQIGTVVIGMAHRGRLNVLAHVLGMPYERILASFRGELQPERAGGGWTGDVKYHQGADGSWSAEADRPVRVLMPPNPSHLEMIDPVAQGITRAMRDATPLDGASEAGMAVLIHGDAAFVGEGVVSETLNLARLEGFGTGGTIHVIANNQIGFTTGPEDAASSLYCTDIARGFDIPVVHVNGDDPEACLAAARLAAAYRQKFHKDFIVDVVGYRRYGHNEGDEPSFTQPRIYGVIAAHPPLRHLWQKRLEEAGVINSGEAETILADARGRLRRALDAGASPSRPMPAAESVPGIEAPARPRTGQPRPLPAVSLDSLKRLNQALNTVPQGFKINSKLERVLQRRLQAVNGKPQIDWGHAEQLALGTILEAGIPVRLSGQDSQRGTFSQRHAVLWEASGRRHVPLQGLPSGGRFEVFNSPLSEEAVLGFEYGYSHAAQGALVLWEAQYGDFVNNAQAMLDEFVVSGWAKWGQRSGLVLLLPHGYEGQGPDHSSAGLERFLQAAAEGNIQVAYPSTAAQYFHLLRRQAALVLEDPRPLVVMTPKGLLRHPLALARADDLAQSSFKALLPGERLRLHPEGVRRLLLCSGRVYADLRALEEKEGVREATAIARVEELYPFPLNAVTEALSSCPHLEEVCWVQEEPQNRGAWTFVAEHLRQAAGDIPVRYVGRPPRASPAEGSLTMHKEHQLEIVRQALGPARAEAIPQGGRREY